MVRWACQATRVHLKTLSQFRHALQQGSHMFLYTLLIFLMLSRKQNPSHEMPIAIPSLTNLHLDEPRRTPVARLEIALAKSRRRPLHLADG